MSENTPLENTQALDTFALHPQLVHDCFELAEFPLCKLLLCNDSTYPWFIYNYHWSYLICDEF